MNRTAAMRKHWLDPDVRRRRAAAVERRRQIRKDRTAIEVHRESGNSEALARVEAHLASLLAEDGDV